MPPDQTFPLPLLALREAEISKKLWTVYFLRPVFFSCTEFRCFPPLLLRIFRPAKPRVELDQLVGPALRLASKG